MKKEKQCIHKWELVCKNCAVEDGDDVYECEICGEEGYNIEEQYNSGAITNIGFFKIGNK